MKQNDNRKAAKAELITINAYHARHGIDRRTIRKYLAEDGLKPVERRNGIPYYRESEITRVMIERHPHHTEQTLDVKKDATQYLKDEYLSFFKNFMRLHGVSWNKDQIGWTWENFPENHDEILNHLRGPLSQAVCTLCDLINGPPDDQDEGCRNVSTTEPIVTGGREVSTIAKPSAEVMHT